MESDHTGNVLEPMAPIGKSHYTVKRKSAKECLIRGSDSANITVSHCRQCTCLSAGSSPHHDTHVKRVFVIHPLP